MSTSIRRAALESWLAQASELVEQQTSFPRRWDEGSATETLAVMLGRGETCDHACVVPESETQEVA